MVTPQLYATYPINWPSTTERFCTPVAMKVK